MNKIILDGAFIKGILVKNNKVTDDVFSIKLSEIKLIYSVEDGSIFYTFKDVRYFTALPEDELLSIINMFIFKQDEFKDKFCTDGEI